MNIKHGTILLILSVIMSITMPGIAAAAVDERETLLHTQKTLQAKVEALRMEQDFLIFHKEFTLSDSKYLVLRPAEGVGELRYRHRLFKRFTFPAVKKPALKRISPGAVVLTRKAEGNHTLSFGVDLILHSKRAQPPANRKSRALLIGLSREDLLSVYSALEPGAQVYVLK
jgi:hypothetical protein